MVEKYYQMTLDKWQSIADGECVSPLRTCGFCHFTRTQSSSVSCCARCPVLVVWPNVTNCSDLPEVAKAQDAYEEDANLSGAAKEVVVLLEENKDALIKAMREIEKKQRKWEKYLIQEFAPNTPISDEVLMRTPKYVVEAPSPGAAIEYFLAIHGMLSYHIIKLGETNLPAEETKEDVLQLIPDIETKASELDRHHRWESWEVARK